MNGLRNNVDEPQLCPVALKEVGDAKRVFFAPNVLLGFVNARKAMIPGPLWGIRTEKSGWQWAQPE
jgi:hypothetical protein